MLPSWEAGACDWAVVRMIFGNKAKLTAAVSIDSPVKSVYDVPWNHPALTCCWHLCCRVKDSCRELTQKDSGKWKTFPGTAAVLWLSFFACGGERVGNLIKLRRKLFRGKSCLAHLISSTQCTNHVTEMRLQWINSWNFSGRVFSFILI